MRTRPGLPDQSKQQRADIEAPPDRDNYSSLLKLASNKAHRLVISLGGGSTPGLSGNLAFLRLLEELDIKKYVTEVWGTSAGAVAGGTWASGNSALDTLRILTSLRTDDVIDIARAKLVWSLLMSSLGRSLPDGIMHGRKLAAAVDSMLQVKSFEECEIPFRCIAVTDDGLNRRKVFRRGPLLPAIMSSMSLPGILLPRERLEGEESGFLDGGLVEKTPLISPLSEHLRKTSKKKLVLIATHFGADDRRVPARGFLSRFIQSLYAMEDTLWEYQLAEARRTHSENMDLLILNPHVVDEDHFNFERAMEHYLHSRAIFKERLQNAELGLTFGQT